ncbi:MAG: hypothetical protein MAG795_00648 [Candidatus Woesearchaeota archaeon]|nr:hypothetical protein [Candidatus Woesearchaeota archaeon]
MRLKLNLTKSIEKNAEAYYEKAKKSKKKLKGAQRALKRTKIKLKRLKNAPKPKPKVKKLVKRRKKQWYEKFRWFISSEDFLCVGGRDATSNEILIKKHTEKNDLVFHTKIQGSPFFVIKTNGKKPGKATLQQTAQATASYSKAWNLGLLSVETFYVKPEQVSKQAPSGEYVEKGSFTINGNINPIKTQLQIAIGIKDDQIIGGPVDAIEKHAEKYVTLKQGKEKTGAAAKKIKYKIGGNLDSIIRFIPSGGVKLN